MNGFVHRLRAFIQSHTGGKIVIAVLFLYLIYAQLILIRHISHQLPLRRLGKDPGLQYQKRMNGLRPFLPSQGVVGYVSDTGEEHFLRAQYALAPVILVRAPGPRFIVANFSHASFRPKLIYGKYYRIIKDFNNGVALLYMDS